MQARFHAPEEACNGTAGQVLPEVPALRGRFLHNEPMSRHVSWRAGGPAQRAYIPADLEDLRLLLQAIPQEEPVHMTGLGSNLLVRDGGVRGVVVLLHGALKKLAIESRSFGIPEAPPDLGETGLLYAEAGVAAPKVARFAANHDLVGGEFLAGIPGTVGGALAMNAGCYGDETWNHVAQVLTLNRQGELNERLPDDYVLGYRHVALRSGAEEWFVSCWLRFARGDGQASRTLIKELLQKRIDTQPLGQPNAGSVFRNPPEGFAARIIEGCGLKGLRVGNAQVSEKHANFIVNLGGATAADIEAVIEKVEEAVEAKTNVRLVREVRIIGERL
jgi:UDP-N-acetylmuramate dehydrogenase